MAKWPYGTQRWERLRKKQLASDPFCRYCRGEGKLVPANTVDHIEPVSESPDKAFDQDNLQSLCPSHHSGAKQAEERRGYSTQVGVEGLPTDPRHPFNRAR